MTSFENANFSTYIYRVLKQIHPDIGFSGTALSAANNLVRINIEKISIGINQLMIRTEKKTIGAREIQSAVRLIIPGELGKHSIAEGTKAITKYESTKNIRKEEKEDKNTKLPSVSRNSMAGLQFPVTRIQNLMMELAISPRKTDSAAVYLAAVCEYLMAEVLELAGNATRDNKRIRITPRYMMMAIKNDAELSKLYQDTVFAGGILPGVTLPAPTPKKKTPKRKGARKTKKDE